MDLKHKRLEIFCGTGGVGKTTVSTSRAVYLAQKGLKVLMITIDPSKRLKEVLGIQDQAVGQVVDVDFEGAKFKALLMSPEQTMQRIAQKHHAEAEFENHILKVLAKPYGGLNEILALLELEAQYSSGLYDCIVLDTAPGKHFVEFLKTVDKINNFFSAQYIEIFMGLSGKVSKNQGILNVKKMLNFMTATGLKKLLGLLSKVTGGEFVDDFVDAIGTIYSTKESFMSALDFMDQVKKEENSKWFLVTSAEHEKIFETMELSKQTEQFTHQDFHLVVNKCLGRFIERALPYQGDLLGVSELLNDICHKERELKGHTKAHFPSVLQFSDVLSESPRNHIIELIKEWH